MWHCRSSLFVITFNIDRNFLKSNTISKPHRRDKDLPQYLGDFLHPLLSVAAYCFHSPSSLSRPPAAVEVEVVVGAVFALNTLFHVLTFPV